MQVIPNFIIIIYVGHSKVVALGKQCKLTGKDVNLKTRVLGSNYQLCLTTVQSYYQQLILFLNIGNKAQLLNYLQYSDLFSVSGLYRYMRVLFLNLYYTHMTSFTEQKRRF